jgi:hypothetical protein
LDKRLRYEKGDVGMLHGGLALHHGKRKGKVADPVRHDDEFFWHFK